MKEIYPSLVGNYGESLRETFGKTLVELAEKYPNFVVLDADVAGGTGTHHFRKSNPDRFFQFGIAEQNMMAAAGGIAATGLIPIVTTFAVFCLRAFEQARLSIAYSKKNVKIVASHPGLDVGPDGASAQSLEDLACFRAIPGMVVISPADHLEMKLATESILKHVGPVYMRSGRSSARSILPKNYSFEIGKGKVLKNGHDVTIFACGVEVARALDAAKLLNQQKISAKVVNISTIKPIDSDLIEKCARQTGAIVTAEDHNIFGGLGSAVAECVASTYPVPMEFVGVKDLFGESGDPEDLSDKYGLSARSIVSSCLKVINRKKTKDA